MANEELRCECEARRLLAVVGYNGDNAFVHLKSHRSGRTLSEIMIDSGKARIKCLSCCRWTTIHVKSHHVDALIEPVDTENGHNVSK